MPRIFDNIDQNLLSALHDTLGLADHADFCVGYFNLRGWKQLDSFVERWPGGDGHCCRLLVGMQHLPQDELRDALNLGGGPDPIDNQAAVRQKNKLAKEFRDQLTFGCPTNEDEVGLRRLAAQIRSDRLKVKLFLKHPLHAKLYLLFRPDPVNPAVGFVGSSNLTMAGLRNQGELNVDVMDHDACDKLARWFEDRWTDRFCLDISEELADIIDQSWAGEPEVAPYHIYLKMAYHLSEDAREGLNEFSIPAEFGNELFQFQIAAVKIAAHHLLKRDGVLIGDVVGLGKTLMATAVARIFEEDHNVETLILCPKNIVPMWEDYRHRYRMRGARVLSISRAARELPDLARYRLVIIDESHNLRNRAGQRYKAIQEYIEKNDSKVILLSATPYNKSYLDLSNQLRLFVPDDRHLGIRPERLLRELGPNEFTRRHQCLPHTLAAFEKSEYPDDWRDLMRLYLVRRTRSFVKQHYAKMDRAVGRKYLEFADGTRSYFPERIPRTIKFALADRRAGGQYATLYDQTVVDVINHLELPRYGLGNYLLPRPDAPPTPRETQVLADLSRAGKRLMGFCRTGLFKRLESSGHAFLRSIERHVLRNYVFLHALASAQNLPIGPQDSAYLDDRVYDGDADSAVGSEPFFDDSDDDSGASSTVAAALRSEADFERRATEVYAQYAGPLARRFRWLRPNLFAPQLAEHLRGDALALLNILRTAGDWDPERDAKLDALEAMLTKKHGKEKVLVFSQFADTVDYLSTELAKRGLTTLAAVTGDAADPTELAVRFSPQSNRKRDRVSPSQELRVLVATDVLSEGQNLQDCAVVVNYDLPWAIIRLVQRVGRVDRIGQKAPEILCYSFLPAEGVERIIQLRSRLRRRLRENAEVVGTDEAFFGDERSDQAIADLYNERAGILDADADDDTEVDLASQAYQIWKDALDRDPSLAQTIPALENVVYSTMRHVPAPDRPEGVLVYLRTAEGNDALAWMDKEGRSVTESQLAVLKAAECAPATPAIERHAGHHELVAKAVEMIAQEEAAAGGQLGRPSGARYKSFDRLMRYAEAIKDTLFGQSDFGDELRRAIDEIHRFPLLQGATDTLNRQLKSGVDDYSLAELAISLRKDGRLCRVSDEQATGQPQIICSLGLRSAPG